MLIPKINTPTSITRLKFISLMYIVFLVLYADGLNIIDDLKAYIVAKEVEIVEKDLTIKVKDSLIIDKDITIADQVEIINRIDANVSVGVDKVYRHVDKKLDLRLPKGELISKVMTSSGIIKKKGNGFIFRPGKGNVAKITVMGPTQRVVKEYAIQEIPRATLSILGETDLPKSSLLGSEIELSFEDFPYNINAKVTQFTLKTPGRAGVHVKGSMMNAKANTAIKRSRAGSTIRITDVVVSDGTKYHFKKPADLIITILK